jgi:hypothetical protein
VPALEPAPSGCRPRAIKASRSSRRHYRSSARTEDRWRSRLPRTTRGIGRRWHDRGFTPDYCRDSGGVIRAGTGSSALAGGAQRAGDPWAGRLLRRHRSRVWSL